jgi:hypothetical protein
VHGLGVSDNRKRSLISSDHVRRLLGAGHPQKRGSLEFLRAVEPEGPCPSILDTINHPNLKSTIFLERSNFALEADFIQNEPEYKSTVRRSTWRQSR